MSSEFRSRTNEGSGPGVSIKGSGPGVSICEGGLRRGPRVVNYGSRRARGPVRREIVLAGEDMAPIGFRNVGGTNSDGREAALAPARGRCWLH